jgi:hypothetical protein
MAGRVCFVAQTARRKGQTTSQAAPRLAMALLRSTLPPSSTHLSSRPFVGCSTGRAGCVPSVGHRQSIAVSHERTLDFPGCAQPARSRCRAFTPPEKTARQDNLRQPRWSPPKAGGGPAQCRPANAGSPRPRAVAPETLAVRAPSKAHRRNAFQTDSAHGQYPSALSSLFPDPDKRSRVRPADSGRRTWLSADRRSGNVRHHP